VDTTVDPVRRATRGQAVRLGFAVATPLAVIALAYALWSISDRLLYIGPLDRATFGWTVVVPVWVSAPIAAGLAWGRLAVREGLVAAIVVGTAISIAAAALFWQAVAYPACDYGAVRAPTDWVPPSLLVGMVVGAGVAASGLVAAAFVRAGRPWRAAALGGGAELTLLFVAILTAAAVLTVPVCQRPPL
jgi:hypothetical protein